MKPRNKIEREVVKLSVRIPELSDKQRQWAIKTVFQKTSLISIETDFQEGVFILYVLSKDGKFSDIFR